MVKIFYLLPDKGLIVSDPSRKYKKYLFGILESFPENILIIDYPHNFIPVIIHSDAMIRATTTDGDALSVEEALFFRKWVIASDCVSRPKGVVLYKTGDLDDLSHTINGILPHTKPVLADEITDGSSELLVLYKSM